MEKEVLQEKLLLEKIIDKEWATFSSDHNHSWESTSWDVSKTSPLMSIENEQQCYNETMQLVEMAL